MRKRIFSLLLAVCLCAQLLPLGSLAVEAAPYAAESTKIVGASGRVVTQQADYALARGVTETKVFLNTPDGKSQVACYMVTVAPDANATFKVSYPGYYTAGSTAASRKEKVDNQNLSWRLETPTKQAAGYLSAGDTADSVLMVKNGDWFNMQTGQPRGYLIMEGNFVQERDPTHWFPYFGVTKDGEYVIRHYGADHSDIVEAISGPYILVENGKVCDGLDNGDKLPLNAIGIKADGTVIAFMCDGRQSPYSVGLTFHEQAEFMQANGAVIAMAMDGGGSTMMATKREGEEQLTIKNRPSDGMERTVASSLLLVTDGKGDGEFDHAVLSPVGEAYTPGSTVQFTAAGVDYAGGKAELPADVSWSVLPEGCGSIDAKGLFTAAADYTGTVTARLSREGAVVGETTVSIVELDEVYFEGASISLDFEASSDLGLMAKNNHRDVNVKVGDFVWEADPKVGSVTDNVFTAVAGREALTGTVKVSYARNPAVTASITVEVGKMPFVALDFEPKQVTNSDGTVTEQPLEAAHFDWGLTSGALDFSQQNGGQYVSRKGLTSVPMKFPKEFASTDRYGEAVSAPFNWAFSYYEKFKAANIFHDDGYDFFVWHNQTLEQYEAGKLKFVTPEDGEVRFGNYSMEMDYEFDKYNYEKNANIYAMYSGDFIPVEGYPTQVGMWVYLPEDTPPYLLYFDLIAFGCDSPASHPEYDYHSFALKCAADTSDSLNSATIYPGWNYWYADIGDFVKQWQNNQGRSIGIVPGHGTVWLSYQPGLEKDWAEKYGYEGTGRKNGTMYFDNIRFVYGTDLDDLNNPVIDKITVGDITLTEGETPTVAAGSPEIYAYFHDADGKNKSGIDAQSTVIALDGKELSADKSEENVRTSATLTAGLHSLTVTAQDKFGNPTTVTRYFQVSGTAATVSLDGPEEVTMGMPYTLTLSADGTASKISMTVAQVNSDFGRPTVEWADGWTGTMTYTETGFKKAKIELTASGSGSGAVATLTFSVPTTMDPEVDFFTYQVTQADCDGNTSSQPRVKRSLSAYYTLTAGVAVAGQPTVLAVTTRDGKPAAGVEVFVNGESAGTTDADGRVTTAVSVDTPAKGTFTASAADSQGRVSFVTTVTVVSAQTGSGITGLSLTASKDGATQQTVSWLSAPDAAAPVIQPFALRALSAGTRRAVVEYAASAADLESGTNVRTAEGTSILNQFSTSKDGAYLNTVTVTGLTPGTTYYFRAGDGTVWSDIGTFKTIAEAPRTTRFFVIGDTQMSGNLEDDQEYIDLLKAIAGKVQGFDFGVQTGDYVDNGGHYGMWTEIQNVFGGEFAGMDMVHTLGNHEYFGDTEANAAAALFNLDGEGMGRDYYSVEYGNVYIAVVNNGANLAEAMEWLKTDAANSHAAWKCLSVHQPAYYTNAKGGSQNFHRLVPPAAEAAGINVVFSGHDHSYARTEPLTGGNVDGSATATDGVTYFICGDLGEKSRSDGYAITNDPAFHFAFASQDYDALYLDVTVTETAMTVAAKNSDGTILDSVTIHPKSGHTHSFDYYKDGQRVCAADGETAPLGDYTGYLTVWGTENKMYFIAGKAQTGWVTVGDDVIHVGDDGIVHETETVDTRTCTQNGYIRSTCKVDGAVRQSEALWAKGHTWNADHHCTVCGTVGRDISLAKLAVGGTYTYTGAAIQPSCSAVWNGETLSAASSRYGRDAYISYTDNIAVGTATVTFEGRGDYYGSVSATFRIVPQSVTGGSVSGKTDTTVTLTWPGAPGAAGYRVEYLSGTAWITAGETGSTSYTVTGLTSETNYLFRILSTAEVNGETYTAVSPSPTISAETNPGPERYTETYFESAGVTTAEGQPIQMLRSGGQVYLLLPAAQDLSSVKLSIRVADETADDPITLLGSLGAAEFAPDTAVDLTAFAGPDADGVYEMSIRLGDRIPMTVKVLPSAGIGAVYLTSDDPVSQGRDYVEASKDNKATGLMQMISADGTQLYNGPLTQLKCRGNSTFNYHPKKSYQIKLGTPTDLLQNGEAVKTWVLLGQYGDATMLHDKLFKDLAARLEMEFTPGCDWVDLFYDGEYRGTYLLSEKNSVGSTGVDITDLEDAYTALNPGYGNLTVSDTAKGTNACGNEIQYTPGLTEPEDISGGYLLELNRREYDEASGFLTGKDNAFNIKSPEFAGQAAVSYISEFYQAFEDAVYATDETGAFTGYNAETERYYYDYVDKTSLVRYTMMTLLSQNVDAFHSSMFFYKEAGDDKLYVGPVWDMDCTCGTGWDMEISASNAFLNNKYLLQALVKIPDFKEALQDYYNEVFRDEAAALLGDNGYVAQMARRLSAGARMNYLLWPYCKYGDTTAASYWPEGTTYADVTAHLQEWLSLRLEVLDKTGCGLDGRAYVVSFDSKGGSKVPSQVVLAGGTLAELPAPTYAGHTFIGWYYNGTAFAASTPITSDLVLTANWDTPPVGPSGDGGGGAAVIAPPASDEPVITKPEAAVAADAKGTVTAKAEVSAAEGSSIVDAVVKNGSTEAVIEPVIVSENPVTKTEVTVPAVMVNGLSKRTEADLTVRTPAGNVTIPNAGLTDLSKSGNNVTVTVEQTAKGTNIDIRSGSDSVGSVSGGVVAAIPARESGIGTVALLVHDDGTTEIIRKSVCKNGTAYTLLDGSASITLVDNTKTFADVPAGKWPIDAVTFASSHELFVGTGANTFSPNALMTRGMIAAVLYRLGHDETKPLTDGFKDVPDGQWYSEAVAWAAGTGVMDGYGSGLFGVEDSVTREQLAAVLYRYSGSPKVSGTLSFKDAGDASPWAKDALLWAEQNGILSGYEGLVNPAGKATRAEVAQIMLSYVTYLTVK